MNFRAIFPFVDFKDEFTFENCSSNEDFVQAIVIIYFTNTDERIKEATLAVYMAYRDHYPKYLKNLTEEQMQKLNSDITTASSKIIKLRRIALSALSKVA